jgi:hypothetical protein
VATIVISIVAIVVGIVGLFVAHRLALGRDRRKEFKEAARPILTWLLAEESSPSLDNRRPSQLEIDTFTSCLSSRKQSEFKASLAEYKSACNEQDQDSIGEMSYRDPKRVRAQARKLLPFIVRR